MKKHATLEDILFSQGFGARRQCGQLIEMGAVRVGEEIIFSPEQTFPLADFAFAVKHRDAFGEETWQTWRYQTQVYLMLHKPRGFEVSQKPSAWPSIYTLLPPPLRQRNKGQLQAVGRLDQDTTGLILLSDDGGFIHRMTSPKKAIEKIYRIRCKHPHTPAQMAHLLAGVAIHEEGGKQEHVVASSCRALDEHHLAMGITHGKYHQVKRMIAAVGNRVEALHRTQIGGLILPEQLTPSTWAFLSPEDIALINLGAGVDTVMNVNPFNAYAGLD